MNLRHIANGSYVDFANNERAPGYELVGLIAGFSVNDAVKIFASAENITDEKYIANVSTISDFDAASSQAVFTPGEGRAFYFGVSADL